MLNSSFDGSWYKDENAKQHEIDMMTERDREREADDPWLSASRSTSGSSSPTSLTVPRSMTMMNTSSNNISGLSNGSSRKQQQQQQQQHQHQQQRPHHKLGLLTPQLYPRTPFCSPNTSPHPLQSVSASVSSSLASASSTIPHQHQMGYAQYNSSAPINTTPAGNNNEQPPHSTRSHSMPYHDINALLYDLCRQQEQEEQQHQRECFLHIDDKECSTLCHSQSTPSYPYNKKNKKSLLPLSADDSLIMMTATPCPSPQVDGGRDVSVNGQQQHNKLELVLSPFILYSPPSSPFLAPSPLSSTATSESPSSIPSSSSWPRSPLSLRLEKTFLNSPSSVNESTLLGAAALTLPTASPSCPPMTPCSSPLLPPFSLASSPLSKHFSSTLSHSASAGSPLTSPSSTFSSVHYSIVTTRADELL